MPRLCVKTPFPFRLLPNVSSNGIVGLRSLATVVEKQANPTVDTVDSVDSAASPAIKHRTPRVSDKILKWTRSAIESGTAHFKVGGKKLYFPKARVILLRPNAKHTPFQAKFIVPKSFNKLDLRDYLFHLYGLRAMNVTTQLLHAKFTRVNVAAPRFRGPQIKKMTIDMAEPFIWPEEPDKKENNAWNDTLIKNLKLFREERLRLGSDQFKPATAFDGAVGPFKPVAQPFVPKFLGREMKNKRKSYQMKLTRMNKLMKLDKYVNA